MTGSLALRELDYVDAGLDAAQGEPEHEFLARQKSNAVDADRGPPAGRRSDGRSRNPQLCLPPKLLRRSPSQLCLRASRSIAAPPPSSVQEGAARLRVSGVSLNELARMFSTRAMPLDKLNAVGRVAGNVNLTWKQSIEKAVAEMAIDSTAPSQAAGNQLPVNGSLRGRYNVISGRTDISSLSLITPHTQVNASGALGSTTVGLALKLNATSLSDFQPLLASLGATPPIDLGGSLSFDGTINGHLRAPDIAGHVEASNFSYIYTPTVKPTQVQPVAAKTETKHRSWLHPQGAPAPPPQPPVASPRRIHVDHFSGDVQYSQNEVALQKATIQEGTALLKIDGTTALDRGAFTDDSRFQVHAAVHDADVTDLQRIGGTDFPLTGKVNFTVQASGTAADPHGDGHISLTGGQLHGRPIKTFTSKIAFANHEAELNDIDLEAAHGKVAGTAAYNVRTEEARLDLRGQSIDLADVPEIQLPHLQTAGVAEFTVKGSGTLEHPVINGHVEIASLVLNGDRVGNLVADAVTQGRQLTVTARSKFPKATFMLDGNMDLEGDMQGSATLKFANLDINPFLPESVRADVTRQASLDGQAEISGHSRSRISCMAGCTSISSRSRSSTSASRATGRWNWCWPMKPSACNASP